MRHLPVRPSRPRTRAHRGASLIEVLVAVLVLSIGMLGLAALQARSLQGNVSSLQRTQGVVMAQHLLDILRADRASAATGAYDLGTSLEKPACVSSDIAGTTFAADSLRAWLDALKAHLGQSGDTTTCALVRCEASAVCAVDVLWDDRLGGGLGAQKLSVSSRL